MSDTTQRRTRRTAKKLALIALAMFGFGYGLALSYDTLCRMVGINPRTERAAAAVAAVKVDTQRTVTLSYSFFNADKASAARYGGAAGPEQKHSGAHAHALTLTLPRERGREGEGS